MAPETAATTQNRVEARGFFAHSAGIRNFSLPLRVLRDVSSSRMNRSLVVNTEGYRRLPKATLVDFCSLW